MNDAPRLPLVSLSRPALVALVLGLAGCVVVTPPAPGDQQLPADFVAGAEYDISHSDCAAKGGQMIRDGNGLAFCAV